MKVYISYAITDQAAADKLAAVLREKGFQVSHPSEEIQPGDNLMLKMGQALESSNAIVVLLSPKASTSSVVLHEIGHAIASPRFSKRLIPVMLEKTENFPWILRKLQVIPFDPEAIAERIRESKLRTPGGRRGRHNPALQSVA